MITFEITIQRARGAVWPVVVEESASGAFLPVRNEGTLPLNVTDLVSLEIDHRHYGTLLGQALFRDDVRDAFVRASVESAGCLRVLLFVEADDLKMLRWERLCAPLDGKWDFLMLDQRVPFSLYLPSHTDQRFPPIGRRDLRSLVLSASPDGLDLYRLQSFDAASAIASVRTALGEIPCDSLGASEGCVGPPTLDALCERITAERYTLLHVVCHGRYSKDAGETILYLSNADGEVDPVTATRLIERMGRLRGARGLPHLALLATCESASPNAEGALGGLAQRMVRDLGMPAVVAMTEKVSVATAQTLAAKFYVRLREHGEVDRALVEATAGLMESGEALVPALYSRLGGRPLFSDTLDRPLTNAEIRFGLEQLKELAPKRAPVLLDLIALNGGRLALDADSAALSPAAREERQKALVALNALCTEMLELSLNALALGQHPAAYDDRCPFRGLYPFRAEDREFFFGRGALLDHLQAKLVDHDFLAVLGSSGSGKSSLVLAGLVPALQAKQPDLQLAYMTPGNDPIVLLEACLPGSETSYILVVDQFEELFTLCRDDDKRRAFVARLLAIAETTPVVLTMRADFWGECAAYPELKELMQSHQELIAPMDSAEMRRAMEKQAAQVGLRFEADLSNTILDDVQGEPGAMPLLQHVLLELWNRRHGRWLRADDYRDLGGVQEAIGRTADRVYEALGAEEKVRARDIFIRLTRLDEEAVRGEERRDTRRRVGLEELVPAGSDPETTKELVKRLADARLVVTSVNSATRRNEVEVAHEALIRYWPRLRRWLDEDMHWLRVRENVSKAAREWQESDRNDSRLVDRGSRLEDADALSRRPRSMLTEVELDYVHSAIKRRDRGRALQRNLTVGLAVLLLAAIVAACFAFQQSGVANEQQRVAMSRELAASAIAQLTIDPERSILLAIESARASPTAQAEEALRTSLAESYVRVVMRGHTDWVTSAVFSPDGRLVVTASNDKTARLWDSSTGQTVGVLSGHQGIVSRASFAPDGKLIVTASYDQTARVWETNNVSHFIELRGHRGPVYTAWFSPDGKYVVTASEDKTARVWETRTGNCLGELRGHTGAVLDASFDRTGRLVVTASSDGTARAWDVVPILTRESDLGTQVAVLQHAGEVRSAEFSRDGRLVVTASEDKTARIWDISKLLDPGPNNAPTFLELKGHRELLFSAEFSPDSRYVVTASNDDTACIWELSAAKCAPELRGHTGYVHRATFSPKGQQVVTTSFDNSARVWDAATGNQLAVLRGHSGLVYGATFSPDGRYIATASYDETARLWEIPPGYEGNILVGHESTVFSVAFSHDGARILTASNDGTAKIWDSRTGALLTTFRGDSGELWGASFSPDDKYAVTAGSDGDARVWDTATGYQLRALQGHTKRIWSAAYSPDGKHIVTSSDDGTVRVWDSQAGQSPIIFSYGGVAAYDAAFSPDGQTIVIASADRLAHIREVATGRELRALAHGDVVNSAEFSPDGRRILTASSDHSARIWDAATGDLLSVLEGHTNWIRRAAFSGDGSQVVTTSEDGTTRVWDAASGKQLSILGHRPAIGVAFSPDGKRIAVAENDLVVRLYFRQLEDLVSFATSRVTRQLTCSERQTYLHENAACPPVIPQPTSNP